VRRAAVEGLARNDSSEMAAALLRLLREEHRNFSILSSALQLLALSKREMVEPLIELLRDDDADLRLQAALTLGEQRDPRAISALMEVLDDEDPNLRFHAIEALGKLQATEAVDVLVGIAETRDFFLSFPALDSLVQINDSRIAPRLIALLSDDLLRAGG
jgi:HEAT repeat protein